MAKQKLSECELLCISRLQSNLQGLQDYFEDSDKDFSLGHGNGTCVGQLSCAIASLECILQEFR